MAARQPRPAAPGGARGGAQLRRAGGRPQLLVGDWAARTVAERQPIKLAAFEGLQETTKGAPFSLVGGIEVPRLLSLLAFHDPNATVKGLDTVPKDDRPPTGIVKLSFRAMVVIGSALAALGAWFICIWWRRRLPATRWFTRRWWRPARCRWSR